MGVLNYALRVSQKLVVSREFRFQVQSMRQALPYDISPVSVSRCAIMLVCLHAWRRPSRSILRFTMVSQEVSKEDRDRSGKRRVLYSIALGVGRCCAC